MPSVVRRCSCSFFTALHTGTPAEGFWCSFLSLSQHMFASLTAKHCCLDSKITGTGVSPESLINAPHGVVGSAPRIYLAGGLSRSWRSSHLPASLGSHHSSLPYSVTALTHATWTVLTLSGTTPYVFVRVQSLASAALASFMHRLWCSLSVRRTSIQTPSEHVACLLNRIKPSPTLIFAVSFGRRCFLWPRLHVNSAASVFAVSNCSPRLLHPSTLVGRILLPMTLRLSLGYVSCCLLCPSVCSQSAYCICRPPTGPWLLIFLRVVSELGLQGLLSHFFSFSDLLWN